MSKPRQKKPVAWIKVYDPAGNYIASFVEFHHTAILLAALGDGATARNGHSAKNTIWAEGREAVSAGESYDQAAMTMHERVRGVPDCA